MDGKDTEKSGAQNAAGGKQNGSQDQAKAATSAKGSGASGKQGTRGGKTGGSAGKGGSQAKGRGNDAARGSGTQGSGNGESTDAIQFLKQQHANIRQLITACEGAEESSKTDSLDELLKAWGNHSRLEEELVVPEAEQAEIDAEMLAKMQVKRDLTKILSAELMNDSPGDEFFEGKLGVLTKMIGEIMQEEEQPKTGILALLKSNGVDTAELGQRLNQEHQQLDAEGEGFDLLAPVAFRVVRTQGTYDQERSMPSYRDRDDQGFMSDDERNYGRSGSRSRYDDDDRRGGYRSSGRMPERDDQGRFMSDDDNYRGSSRSRGSDYDYDVRRGSGRSCERMPERDEQGRFMSND
jgi:hypothetical protein